HIASCMAENKLEEKVIGIAFDGTGYGEDHKIWGGEFILADLLSYQRIGHLKYQPMPGGEQAIHQPWRMVYSYLYSVFGQKITQFNIGFIKRRSVKEIDLISQMIEKKINSPLTSSCGRLFDAVASIIGIRDEVNFEGQAAVALESLCNPAYKGNYSYGIDQAESGWLVNVEEMFREIVQDIEKNKNISGIATRFHNTLAEFILSMCVRIRDKYYVNLVVLSGGVFQNSFLLNQTLKKLNDNGFKVFIHKKMPPNDACIALGQAVIANERSADGYLILKGKTDHEMISHIVE
ncbi:MAG: carbamoyltransferase HypF, partial [Candidatus Atribacteria bacterium]|nr:carbamoyltransferase HypF [Candidatus Atribacteria bacterium]